MQLENIQIWLPLFSVIVGIASAILTSFVTHRLTAKRDIENKQREQRINYLIEAFQSLATVGDYSNIFEAEASEKIKNAATIIQLFGDEKQIKLINTYIVKLANNNSVLMDELLNSLRDNLRRELKLEEISQKLFFPRFIPLNQIENDSQLKLKKPNKVKPTNDKSNRYSRQSLDERNYRMLSAGT